MAVRSCQHKSGLTASGREAGRKVFFNDIDFSISLPVANNLNVYFIRKKFQPFITPKNIYMKKLFIVLVLSLALFSCKKNANGKVNIHITNNRNNTITVEFRAGGTVCSTGYVSANSTNIDEAYAAEYDVYVADYINGTVGQFSYHSHGLFYDADKYITVN
jgi:hypothetical protein